MLSLCVKFYQWYAISMQCYSVVNSRQSPSETVMPDKQMAVFLVNWCKFRGCGLTFTTLGELIQHIEEIHISTKD